MRVSRPSLQAAGALALLTVLSAPSYSAAVCPFARGGEEMLNEGLVLTRYSLGVRGNALVSGTKFSTLDPAQAVNNIECLGCSIDLNGDGEVDATDTTIISRHIAGFTGDALTFGLALGAGSRNSTQAVQSFIQAGCSAISSFVNGGNAFGGPATIGTVDPQPLDVVSGHPSLRVVAGLNFDGIRIRGGDPFENRASNIIAGSSSNTTGNVNVQGATISGGGTLVPQERNRVDGNFGTVSGGHTNIAGAFAVVSGGTGNGALSAGSVVSGGTENCAGSGGSWAGGTRAKVRAGSGTVRPAESGCADVPLASTVGGDTGSFIWADASSANAFVTDGPNQFSIRAAGGVRLSAETTLSFGSGARQLINLQGTDSAIGVQNSGPYVRIPSGGSMSWHFGGVHDSAGNSAGSGGTEVMRLTPTELRLNGVAVSTSSDVSLKENIRNVDVSAILKRVAALPISTWNYRHDPGKVPHIGPTAQDFHRSFSVGRDDKMITTVDAAGVALAAIKGLANELDQRDRKLAQQRADIEALKKELAALRKLVTRR